MGGGNIGPPPGFASYNDGVLKVCLTANLPSILRKLDREFPIIEKWTLCELLETHSIKHTQDQLRLEKHSALLIHSERSETTSKTHVKHDSLQGQHHEEKEETCHMSGDQSQQDVRFDVHDGLRPEEVEEVQRLDNESLELSCVEAWLAHMSLLSVVHRRSNLQCSHARRSSLSQTI